MGESRAHADGGENYIFLSVNADSITGRFEIHQEDLLKKLGIEMPAGDESAASAELAKTAPRVQEYIRNHFSMGPVGGKPYELTFDRTKVMILPGRRFAQYYFSIPLTELPKVLEFDHRMLYENDPLHRAILALTYNHVTQTKYGGEFATLLFSPRTPVRQLDLTGEIKGMPRTRDFVREGVWHIWFGYDHMLFLLVLLLPAVLRRDDGKWQPTASFPKASWNVLKIVTVFTLAHSITLALAGLEIVRLPPRLVESVIAMSIVLVALNNIVPKVRAARLAAVFVLGLFHGLGFASVMGNLQFRIVEIKKVVFAFNVGIELGQIAVVVPAFILLYLARKSRFYLPAILTGGSAIAGALALVWFVRRAFGL